MDMILAATTDIADLTQRGLNIGRTLVGVLFILAIFFFCFNLLTGKYSRERGAKNRSKTSHASKRKINGGKGRAYSYSAKKLEGEKSEREQVRDERRTEWERERKKNKIK